MSFGPVSWLYMSEIFSNRTREIGIAVGTATQWLFNFVFSQATPHAVDNLGWRTFLMFAIFNWALVVYSWLVIKEVSTLMLCENMALTYPVDDWKISRRHGDCLWLRADSDEFRKLGSCTKPACGQAGRVYACRGEVVDEQGEVKIQQFLFRLSGEQEVKCWKN